MRKKPEGDAPGRSQEEPEEPLRSASPSIDCSMMRRPRRETTEVGAKAESSDSPEGLR